MGNKFVGRNEAETRRSGTLGRGLRAALIVVGASGTSSAMAGFGEPDPQFGEGGQVRVLDNLGPHLLEQSDGRIVLIGQVPGELIGHVVMSRFLSTGEVDVSFGDHGRTEVEPYGTDGRTTVSAVAQQADGKLLLAGTHYQRQPRAFIARTDPNGVLDAGFGSGGVTEPCQGGTEPFYSSVIARDDGDILATISDWTSDRVDHFASDGSPLGGFYRSGFAPHRAVLQSGGQLIVSGYERSLKRPGLVRLDRDGVPDPTFGQDGFVALDDGYLDNIAVEPATDRIVLCGGGIARFTPDGQPDVTFGAQGTGRVQFGADSVPSFEHCQAVSTMWDGSIAYIGTRSADATPAGAGVYVAGLDANGLADLRFGAGSGASLLDVAPARPSGDYYGERSSALVRTHDGDALLVWGTTDDVRLLRIDLDAGSDPGQSSGGSGGGSPGGSTCKPGGGSTGGGTTGGGSVSGGSAGGASSGGGALAWPDLLLLLLASVPIAWIRRRRVRL